MNTIAGRAEPLTHGRQGRRVSDPRSEAPARRPTSIRHRWGEPDRRLHETIRTCAKCGLMKITHHEGEYHWMEYATADGDVRAIKIPPCVGGSDA